MEINYARLSDYVCKCPACGYERRLSPKDLVIRGKDLKVRTVCPRCGSNCTIIYKPLH